jgi:hypothetical protein
MNSSTLNTLVALVVLVWLALAWGLVRYLRKRYAAVVEQLMKQHSSARALAADAASPRLPARLDVERTVIGDAARAFFRVEHRRRLVVFALGGVAYGVTYGAVNITRVALNEGKTESLWLFLSNLGLMGVAAEYALLPVLATLAVLGIRRLQNPASGIWMAALICIAPPFGALSINLDLPKLMFRLVLGPMLAYAYVRFNAFRAERSPWSFHARGLNAFYFVFGFWWFVSHLLFGDWYWGVAIALLPYLAYEGTLRAAFRLVPKRVDPKRLLLLRVFGRPGQSERLYRDLLYDWSTLGPIWLIGAPDVAKRSMTPQRFAAFVSGTLRRHFEWSDAWLEQQVAETQRPLLDRTYRWLELLCAGESWRGAVQRLTREADVVVMDLRGFTEENLGCAWELAQLVNLIPLSKVVLCIDQDTQRPALETALRGAWRALVPTSPNAATLPPFGVLSLGEESAPAIDLAFSIALDPNRQLSGDVPLRAAS